MVTHRFKYSCKKRASPESLNTVSKATAEAVPDGARSVGVLFGCDGDQLLGSLGNVVGALDDLLGDQLDVGRGARLGREGLRTLGMQAEGAGGQQPQRGAHQLRWRLLGKNGTLNILANLVSREKGNNL